jgi:hypothetical protein
MDMRFWLEQAAAELRVLASSSEEDVLELW